MQFIEGDINRLVIVGGLYGGVVNQFALDDAPGQLRTRLHASHADAGLGLGQLIQHSAKHAQCGAWRDSQPLEHVLRYARLHFDLG